MSISLIQTEDSVHFVFIYAAHCSIIAPVLIASAMLVSFQSSLAFQVV